jgi:N-methylhydantoinase B
VGTLGAAWALFGFDPKRQRSFVVQSIVGGGWGGRPWEDGESASVSVCQGDVRNAPVESIELRCPVLIDGRILRQDSGGAGRYRGGLGLETRVRNLVEGQFTVHNGGRTLTPPWGLWGGRAGSVAGNRLKRSGADDLETVDTNWRRMLAGSTAIMMSAGGGGWGDPLDRDPEEVRSDVVEEYVSLEAARGEYGVVLDPRNLAVDESATIALRAELRAARPAQPAG